MIEIGNLKLDTDFEYRIIREEEGDIDLFIDVNYRSLDIDCDGCKFFNSRIQFPFVRSLILRINKDNHLMTIHLMRDIDLFSAFANFEFDYKNYIFNIKNNQEKVLITRTSI
ncbi:hypothetical protein EAI30_10060 [Romboutsia ilealis]|uniref:Uncharacterized protein n=1 Tax=Romboutsia faecis TaxID=2764597 RepID=A0ABR7JR61_9FIRM|nr:hypothetical protein [Romboutsia faecis]MBC5997407.1 hypothetical protein [Romboutsia faecis]MRN24960.1 hypothetical protein [Romboutsia ilealis]